MSFSMQTTSMLSKGPWKGYTLHSEFYLAFEVFRTLHLRSLLDETYCKNYATVFLQFSNAFTRNSVIKKYITKAGFARLRYNLNHATQKLGNHQIVKYIKVAMWLQQAYSPLTIGCLFELTLLVGIHRLSSQVFQEWLSSFSDDTALFIRDTDNGISKLERFVESLHYNARECCRLLLPLTSSSFISSPNCVLQLPLSKELAFRRLWISSRFFVQDSLV